MLFVPTTASAYIGYVTDRKKVNNTIPNKVPWSLKVFSSIGSLKVFLKSERRGFSCEMRD